MTLDTKEKQLDYTYRLAEVLGVPFNDLCVITRLKRIKESFNQDIEILDKMVDTTVSH